MSEPISERTYERRHYDEAIHKLNDDVVTIRLSQARDSAETNAMLRNHEQQIADLKCGQQETDARFLRIESIMYRVEGAVNAYQLESTRKQNAILWAVSIAALSALGAFGFEFYAKILTRFLP